MALMTVREVKRFVRISESDSSYDALIAEYLPIIEDDICEYLNNYFEDRAIFVDHGAGLAFVRGNTLTSVASADYVTDDNDDFSTAGFAAGMDVVIVGGSNSGIYTVASVSSGTLTMTSTGEFVAQDQDLFYKTPGRIRIARMRWPDALKPTAAQMIWYQIENSKPNDAISEKVDDYSITYAGSNAYPARLVAKLSRYRMAVSQ